MALRLLPLRAAQLAVAAIAAVVVVNAGPWQFAAVAGLALFARRVTYRGPVLATGIGGLTP